MSHEETNNDGKKFFDKYYIGITTSIGIFIAFINSILLYKIDSDYISSGIGLAMVGIVTFFGMLIASSVFEEHRHHHTNKPNKDVSRSQNQPDLSEKIVANVIAGNGIMRKAIASSLIIVYIIVIGLYIENGELNEPFPRIETPTSDSQESTMSGTTTDSINTSTLQLIQDNDDGIKPMTKSGNQTTKVEESNETAKPIPQSLIEHFTTVITTVIVFYFGTDIASYWFKNKYGSGSTTRSQQSSTSIDTQKQQKDEIDKIQKKIAELKDELEKIKKKKDG